MTTQEIHIAIDMAIQNINSNVRTALQPEEKDFLFNAAAFRFVKARTNPKSNPKQEGFQNTVKRYEDLDELIVRTNLPLLVYDSEQFYAQIPPDCYTIIEESGLRVSLKRTDCGAKFSDYTVGTNIQNYIVYPFPMTNNTNYADYELKFGTDSIFKLSNYPYYATGLNDPELRFEIINEILHIIQQSTPSGVTVYWEQWNGEYFPNSLIFVGYSGVTLNLTQVLNTVSTVYNNTTLVKSNYIFSNPNILPVNATKTVKSPSRLVKTAEVWNINRHPFWRTKWDSPVCTLDSNVLFVTHQERFICDSIELTYIKNPRKINLHLNITSEFSDDRVLEIVDQLAVDYAARVQQPNYPQLKEQHNSVE